MGSMESPLIISRCVAFSLVAPILRITEIHLPLFLCEFAPVLGITSISLENIIPQCETYISRNILKRDAWHFVRSQKRE